MKSIITLCSHFLLTKRNLFLQSNGMIVSAKLLPLILIKHFSQLSTKGCIILVRSSCTASAYPKHFQISTLLVNAPTACLPEMSCILKITFMLWWYPQGMTFCYKVSIFIILNPEMTFQVDTVYIYYVGHTYLLYRSRVWNIWLEGLNLYIIIICMCVCIIES